MFKLSMPILLIALLVGMAQTTEAATTINASDKYAYGANIGWINAQGDVTNGAMVEHSCLSGYIYSANCGWICLGNGPTNGTAYSNGSATDFGVNMDADGNLNGFAYGANIGWVNFEANGAPNVSKWTGAFDGFAYGANVGWISLSNAMAYVKTDSISPGPDSEPDGLPDKWELEYAPNLGTLVGNDFDGDGVPDEDEYEAGTDPTDGDDYLHITNQVPAAPMNEISWPSVNYRLYSVEQAVAITNGVLWVDSGLGQIMSDASGSMTETVTNAPSTEGFFRIRCEQPLAP